MAPVIPSIEPTEAIAGSTWKWTLSSSTYPISEGWTLSYAIRGQSAPAWSTGWIDSTAEPHVITIPATVTDDIVAGRYELTRVWTGSASYANIVYREACPPLTVTADPVTAAAGDRVSFAETNLAYVESAIQARLSGDEPMAYTIGGREVQRMPIEELYKLRAQLRQELRTLRGFGRQRFEVVFNRAS